MSNTVINAKTCQLGCGSAAEWGPGECSRSWGPEYKYAGTATGCGTGGCAAAKQLVKCQHFQYTGSAADCCTGANPGYDYTNNGQSQHQRTCNPELVPSNAKCDSTLQTFCAQGTNIFTHPKCIDWRTQRETAAKSTVELYSNQNLATDLNARAWCVANQGKCDVAATAFCKAKPTDPFCACLMSPAPKFSPSCIDAKCLTTGYKSSAMTVPSQCPPITSCDIGISGTAGGNFTISDKVTMVQNCGNTTAPAPTTTTPTKPTTTTQPPVPTPGSTNTSWQSGSAATEDAVMEEEQSLLTGRNIAIGGGLLLACVLLIMLIVALM